MTDVPPTPLPDTKQAPVPTTAPQHFTPVEPGKGLLMLAMVIAAIVLAVGLALQQRYPLGEPWLALLLVAVTGMLGGVYPGYLRASTIIGPFFMLFIGAAAAVLTSCATGVLKTVVYIGAVPDGTPKLSILGSHLAVAFIAGLTGSSLLHKLLDAKDYERALQIAASLPNGPETIKAATTGNTGRDALRALRRVGDTTTNGNPPANWF